MGQTSDIQNRITKLKAAFQNDGYTVKQDPLIIKGQNGGPKIGIVAESPATIGGDSSKKKKAYYVEGAPYDLGRLMGRLAKADIRRMAFEFVDEIVFAFLNIESVKTCTNDAASLKSQINILGEILVQLVLYPMVAKVYSTAVPQEIKEEIQGMVDGGGYILPWTRKELLLHLQVLNLGVDVLCAFIYTLNEQILRELEAKAERKFRKKIKLDPSFFKIPVFCNAFSILGKAAGGGHYFGRDFMFPNAGVFQDVATLIVYNPDPDSKPGILNLPLVSATAPGFAGSIAAMNSRGVAAGVDMRPAKNCNCEEIGLNSLPMVRCAIQHSDTAVTAADFIVNNVRGVSWIYPISDGTHDRACVVEAGAPGVDPLLFIPKDMLQILPPGPFPTGGYQVRWSDDPVETKKIYDYIGKYNQKLVDNFNRKLPDPLKKPVPDVTQLGFVYKNPDQGNKKALKDNCPSVYYFAPPRWSGDVTCNQGETLILANHYLDPVMRLYSMGEWLSLLSTLMGHVEDDSQWRYDELNSLICDALGVDPATLKPSKAINYAKAKELIEFLAPYPGWPCEKYYNPDGQDYKLIQIGGCISIFDLKKRTVETHAGYYGDEWIRITLPNYLP
ncbi:MAG TPA: hypothetical protein VHY08_29095 [Bacillota bacterium]|nr:hypothetical protein [Bacillota bacterium]